MLTKSPLPVRRGRQEPRVASYPESSEDLSAGEDALALADVAGRDSFPWQEHVVTCGMAKRADGKWAAFEVGVLVSRQNGKNGCIEVVELGWMINEPGVSILHTAHEFQTALESMDKLEALIRSHPLLENEIEQVRHGNGKESIKLRNGSIIRFRTRTKSGGRGFSVDRLVIDEAMIWSPASQAAIMPLLTTAENPQIWYLGSAADADTHEYCGIWASLRSRATSGGDERLCWMEWSAPELHSDATEDEHKAWREDRENWAYSNPSYGYLVSEEYIKSELATFKNNLEKWEIERLSVGKWPAEDVTVEPLVNSDVWSALCRLPLPGRVGTKALAIDASWDQEWWTIAAAQKTDDGRVHLEIGFHERVPRQEVVAKVKALVGKWDPCAVVMDKKSPAMIIERDLIDVGIEPETTTAPQMVTACSGWLYDATHDGLSHVANKILDGAVENAQKRTISGGAWAVERESAGTLVSPLIAGILARWALIEFGSSVKPPPADPSIDLDTGSSADYFDAFSIAF